MATTAPRAACRLSTRQKQRLEARARSALLSSIVIGVASTAPGYNSATLGGVSAEVGTKAPLIMLVAFVPMLFILVRLQSSEPRQGGLRHQLHWVAKAFGTHAGWLTGWAIVIADIIVMAALASSPASTA